MMRSLSLMAAGLVAAVAPVCGAATVDFSWAGPIRSATGPASGEAQIQFGPLSATHAMNIQAADPEPDTLELRGQVILAPLTVLVPEAVTPGQDFTYAQDVFVGGFQIVDRLTGHIWMTGDVDVTGQKVVLTDTDSAADLNFLLTNVQVFASVFTADTGGSLADSPNLMAMASGHALVDVVITSQSGAGMAQAIADGSLLSTHSGTATVDAVPLPAAALAGAPLLGWVMAGGRRRKPGPPGRR